mmetsp:Transcript_29106/g.69307  ORF Transcript_29106/g.69307 Transcript_29106/m.69307 type:complete len:234 (+) Transcript_29106:1592-2293(+)
MDKNLLPVGRSIVPTQVGFHLPRENFEGSGFAYTVRPDQSEDLSRTRHREPVQLEAVRPVPVRGIPLQVLRQIDDVDGIEGTFFDADATPDAERLGEESDLRLGPHLDAQLAQLDDRACLLALLPALLRLAPFGGDDGDTREGVRPRIVVLLLAPLLLSHVGACACVLPSSIFISPRSPEQFGLDSASSVDDSERLSQTNAVISTGCYQGISPCPLTLLSASLTLSSTQRSEE